MINVPDKGYREYQSTIFYSVLFFNRVIYGIMWKSITEPGRPQLTI